MLIRNLWKENPQAAMRKLQEADLGAPAKTIIDILQGTQVVLRQKLEEEAAAEFLMEAETAPDLVLADPPRAGLGSVATARLLELAPKKIVIVACDPSTLARDLAAMKERYDVERITMVDLFPQTFHIETIVGLRLR